jgi:cellulose synthase/poly-beta-1,6-N-acetylglucosamine synthase-like glycosyltransferase
VFYTYAGYGLVAWLWIRIRGIFSNANRTVGAEAFELPTLALIVAAYNEEQILAGKINNCLELDYPADKIRILVVTDGSTDRSAGIVNDFPAVMHMHLPDRRGKVAAINRAVNAAGDVDILVFSDANTMLNKEALLRLVSHYKNPMVGGVSGEKKVMDIEGSTVRGESFYWRYESGLKKLDASFHTIVGAAGELFSVRRSLYEPVPEDVVLDDFYISLKVCEKGYQVKYEPTAFAMEKPSLTMQDEAERKTRISAGAFQSMIIFAHLMNPLRYGKLSFQYLSRRVFRWVICPIALPLIFLLNIYIYNADVYPEKLYSLVLFLQVIFYLLATLGWIFAGKKAGKNKVIHIPYYFLFMNLSVWFGFFRFIKGGQSAIWEKVKRDQGGA